MSWPVIAPSAGFGTSVGPILLNGETTCLMQRQRRPLAKRIRRGKAFGPARQHLRQLCDAEGNQFFPDSVNISEINTRNKKIICGHSDWYFFAFPGWFGFHTSSAHADAPKRTPTRNLNSSQFETPVAEKYPHQTNIEVSIRERISYYDYQKMRYYILSDKFTDSFASELDYEGLIVFF